ncbi:sugar phosphate isomerase/epimerase [Litorilinea aerophila]|uniref:Sugar phosphate isomerase/epimerase n=1 Tax=Litorilinea aerophila TaxID=1204385 RepID=A0A540VJ55_9CHLR|nr:sugar phosphate isomerase/epimerase family protein [Litorilinea aerophila]MCC9075666.1 sugar phosphate isomerase/epimerase [Litorilinea aerophila]
MADRFPLAFSTLGCPDWSLETAAAQAAAHGYRGLEIRLLDGEVIPADLPTERRRAVRETMARHNLQIVGLGLSTRFSSPDPAERQANLELLERYLALANELEVPMVRTFGGNVHPDHTLDETVTWLADALNAAVPAAERYGVDIVLETHDAFSRGEDVAKVLAQVDSPRVGAIWDVHHPYRMGESIEETWRYIGPRVKHVHIKDARRRPDGSWQLVLLGEGEVPCRAAVELLHREGYQGFVSVEWEKKWHPEIEEPEVALPQHARVLREWFAALAG